MKDAKNWKNAESAKIVNSVVGAKDDKDVENEKDVTDGRTQRMNRMEITNQM